MILFLIVGFRSNCGSDYYNYYERYIAIDSWYHSVYYVIASRFQSGFDTICYIIKRITRNDFALFPAVAILMYAPTISIIRKRSEDCALSIASWVLLGFLLMSTNIII